MVHQALHVQSLQKGHKSSEISGTNRACRISVVDQYELCAVEPQQGSTHHLLIVLLKDILRKEDRRHRRGPPCVESEVRNKFDDFVLPDAMFKGAPEMEG